MKVILGLGNPGAQYVGTRHNLGFRCVEYLGHFHGVKFNQKRKNATFGIGEIEDIPVVIAKNRTYMNQSGESIRYFLSRFLTNTKELLIVYDDLTLTVGKLRIRSQGSSGGHRGVESIIRALGTEEFPRLRLGISRPPEQSDQGNYVLSSFTAPEELLICDAVYLARRLVRCFLQDGIEVAMNRFN